MGYDERLLKLRACMAQNGEEARLVHKAENIRYLSGFTGGTDGILFVTPEEQFLLTDSRYTEQAAKEAPAWKLVELKGSAADSLQPLCKSCKKIAVEAHALTWQQYLQYQAKLSAVLTAGKEWIEELRAVKEKEEISCLKKAGAAGDIAFSTVLEMASPGMTEMEIANHIVFALKDNGCSGESFETIAISGAKSALPHGRPDETRIREDDVLLMDYGGFFGGYAGDMTRTVFFGKPGQLFFDRYRMVLEAQMEGLQAVKAGAICSQVDGKVRKVLEKYGLERYYIHATGHGVGLEIHEAPRLGRMSETILKENMAVTVEPGIYIPGWGGIRIEDSVIVLENGCELLNHADKDIILL